VQHLRTSEDERQRVLNYLRDCCAEGYLDIDELDERQSRVLRSRTRGELAALVADMPGSAQVLPGAGQAPPTFVKQRGGRVTATTLVAIFTLLAVMVLVSVPVFELLIFGGFVLALAVFGLVVFVSLSPWLAAGALVAWSVNRIRQRPAPHQLH
jgi:hypothetical protein